MEYNLYSLKNGIRIIHKRTLSEVTHCGFVINTGSRDENIDKSGITHFIEHAFFKGTNKRKSHHILNRIDSVGGEINAYTTKENTSIYASFTNQHFERAIELLSDILFNSTFPKVELDKEKEVVIDEINSYLDSPYEQIYDDFEEMVFKDHPLGMNILGTEKTVKKLKQKDILTHISNNYQTDQIVFSIVGNIPLKKVEKLCEKYLAAIPEKKSIIKRNKFNTYQAKQTKITKEIYQTHCLIGSEAYSSFDPSKTGFILLNNILGGPAMNSRLNMGIREKYGYAYNIESSYTTFSDTGLFYIYFGTDQKHLGRCLSLVHKELKLLREKQISSAQLKKAKQQLIGQITLSEENNCNVMLGIGKSILLHNKVDSLLETYEKINAISQTQLQEIANNVFEANKLSSLIYTQKT